jgi:hypothetical protein
VRHRSFLALSPCGVVFRDRATTASGSEISPLTGETRTVRCPERVKHDWYRAETQAYATECRPLSARRCAPHRLSRQGRGFRNSRLDTTDLSQYNATGHREGRELGSDGVIGIDVNVNDEGRGLSPTAFGQGTSLRCDTWCQPPIVKRRNTLLSVTLFDVQIHSASESVGKLLTFLNHGSIP